MKAAVFAILVIVAGALASPRINSNSRSVVEDQIRQAIERIGEYIKERNADPVIVESAESEIGGGLIVGVKAFVENLRLSGLSGIHINNLEYNTLLNRLRLNVSLVELSLSIGNAGLEIRFIEHVDKVEVGGSLVITDVNLNSEISFDISLINGITVRTITIEVSIKHIESELSFVAFGDDHSDLLNSIVGGTIPALLKFYRNEINRSLEAIIRSILNAFLPN